MNPCPVCGDLGRVTAADTYKNARDGESRPLWELATEQPCPACRLILHHG